MNKEKSLLFRDVLLLDLCEPLHPDGLDGPPLHDGVPAHGPGHHLDVDGHLRLLPALRLLAEHQVHGVAEGRPGDRQVGHGEPAVGFERGGWKRQFREQIQSRTINSQNIYSTAVPAQGPKKNPKSLRLPCAGSITARASPVVGGPAGLRVHFFRPGGELPVDCARHQRGEHPLCPLDAEEVFLAGLPAQRQ